MRIFRRRRTYVWYRRGVDRNGSHTCRTSYPTLPFRVMAPVGHSTWIPFLPPSLSPREKCFNLASFLLPSFPSLPLAMKSSFWCVWDKTALADSSFQKIPRSARTADPFWQSRAEASSPHFSLQWMEEEEEERLRKGERAGEAEMSLQLPLSLSLVVGSSSSSSSFIFLCHSDACGRG